MYPKINDNPENSLALATAGQAANQAASQGVFEDYRSRKSPNTLRAQQVHLDNFAGFLARIGAGVGDLAEDPQAWAGVTWGLVAAWQRWLLKDGYAISTINLSLTTIRTYANLAQKAGALSHQEAAMIRDVQGYSRAEAKRIDEQRTAGGLSIRKSHKKEVAITLTNDQARALKKQPDSPQGRRDTILMALLIDHGLRVGEVARLIRSNFDLKTGHMRFYRPKVDLTQTHELSRDTLKAARAYFRKDAPAAGIIWRASFQDGSCINRA